LVPAASQGPVDTRIVLQTLADARQRWGRQLAVDLSPLIDAFTDLPPVPTLGWQMALVTERLLRPWTGPMPILCASELGLLPDFARLVEQMRQDAPRCAACYNQA